MKKYEITIQEKGNIVFEEKTNQPFELIYAVSRMTFADPLLKEVNERELEQPILRKLLGNINPGDKIDISIQKL